MIKQTFFAVSLFCMPALVFADCPHLSGLSAPMESMDNFVFKPSAICLDGKDITPKIKQYNDEVVTSSTGIGKNLDFLYVGLYSESHNIGRIVAVYQLNDGACKCAPLSKTIQIIRTRPKTHIKIFQ